MHRHEHGGGGESTLAHTHRGDQVRALPGVHLHPAPLVLTQPLGDEAIGAVDGRGVDKSSDTIHLGRSKCQLDHKLFFFGSVSPVP